MNRKILVLSVIAGIVNVSSVSFAETNVLNTWDCGQVSNTVSCKLYEDGTFVISGSGKMTNYNYVDNGENVNWHDRFKTDAPWSDKNITKVVVENGVTSIANHAFTGNKTIKSVEGMNDVKIIGNRAFFDNQSLEKIDMPSVTTVGYESFYFAEKLSELELPKATDIYADAFMASGISSLYLPNVKNLSERALRGIGNLTSLDMPNVEYVGHKALYSSNLNYVGLPQGGVVFEDDAFLEDSILANCGNDRLSCGVCEEYVKRGLGCVPDCGNGMLGKEHRCIDASLGCGEGYTQIENWCSRIRYTLPEADDATSDDYENMIEWIFE